METLFILAAIAIGFCLIWPWVVCWAQKERVKPNFFERYLDWVYDVVNRTKGD